jgi:DNA polymerase elongation subunit (family B)
MSDNLIFGKDKTPRVVGLEIDNEIAEVFIQQENGTVISEIRENRYWILSRNPLNEKSKRLDGNLFYRYIITTKDREVFTQGKKVWKNKDIYSVYNAKEAFMMLNGLTYYKGMKHNELNVLSFDIETTGLKHNETAKVLLISNTYRDSSGKITRKLFSYDQFANQGIMLTAWCNWVIDANPDVILGHNILGFDLPYMQYIADQEGITLDLGRNGAPIRFNGYNSKFRVDGSRDLEYKAAQIYGREIIDTMFLAYKYDIGRKYESYGLKKIIAFEGLEVKDREFYDASQIRFNYTNPIEWAKIKKYAIMDADDSLALFDLMAPSQFYWTQTVPKSFQSVTESATGSQINSILIRAYLQDGHSLPCTSKVEGFEGALSYAKPGIYTNHIRFDVAALYPSIILQYKLYDKQKDPKGYYYQLTSILRDARLKNKKLAKETGLKYYKDMEQSQKVGINSIYGTAGAPGILFNSIKVADAVTKHGREILSKAVLWATSKDIKEWMPQDEVEVIEDV